MVDLHTHTNYSDGTWPVDRLLEEAEEAKVEILAITDHDDLRANKELLKGKYSGIFSGKIITGVELSSVFKGVKIELLAYNFDVDILDKWVTEKYVNYTLDLKKEFDLMYNSAKSNGIRIDEIIYDESMGWPVDVIFPKIKKYEENKKYFSVDEWNDIDKFFKASINNPGFATYVDLSIHYPTAKEVAREVRKAGGKVFVAHIFKYHIEDYWGFLEMLIKEDVIDGVEVYHSSFSDDNMELLRDYCTKNGLLMSGGSDCHGDKRKDSKIGIGYGNIQISKEVIKDWIN